MFGHRDLFTLTFMYILHNLYSSPNTVRVIKSRSMRWAGHVALGDQKCIQNFSCETHGRNYWRDLDIAWRIILKWYVRMYTGFNWSRMDPVAGPCGHSNTPSASLKDKYFMDQLSNSNLLKKE
jgi:hypothetical protein